MSVEKPRLRLLILSPFAPRLDAPHGGGRVIAELVTGLAERHHVALLCLRPEGDLPADDLVRQRCEFVEEFELPGVGRTPVERWRRRVGLLAGLARGRPMWVADTSVAAFATRLREVVESWKPDVVQAEYHVMAQYLTDDLTPGTVRVLTEEEPGTTAAEDAWREAAGPMRLLLAADAKAWRRFETAILNRVDAVVAYTERDRLELASLAPGAQVVRIPLGVRIPPEPLDPAGTEPNSLVFVGNFMHPPNVDAARRLVSAILPRVASQVPEARLYLVGDRVPAFIRREAAPNIIITGLVADVTPYLDRAALAVAPLRKGGGQRVKVMEALAAGKALVASRSAVEGLDVENGQAALFAETDDEFVDAVLGLLADERQRVALASNARSWAEANLRSCQSVDRYEDLYEELLRARMTRPRT